MGGDLEPSATHILCCSCGIYFSAAASSENDHGIGRNTKLDYEIAGQVFRFNFSALFPPQPEEGGFIVTHDDPSIGTPNKITAAVTVAIRAIRHALTTRGVEFVDENGGGPGVRLRKRHQKKS